MTTDKQSLPPPPLFLRKLGIKACAEVMDYGDARAAHARQEVLVEWADHMKRMNEAIKGLK